MFKIISPVKCMVIGLILLCMLPAKSLGLDAKISDFLITNTADNVIVYFRVNNCFTDEIREAILAGIPTTFTFYLRLYRQRNFWPDKELSDLELKHTIKYDNVKKMFYVHYAGYTRNPEQFTSFERAQAAMSDLNGLAVAPLNVLTRNKRYYVRVKAELDKVRLPLHMEYVFFFVSLWDFETDWYREDFIY